uniref:Uncharacterized protein n=1 Tax=Kalanchoe fedtschenkoi TaxID=63787 RepID=A0A7N0TZN1_KALFE
MVPNFIVELVVAWPPNKLLTCESRIRKLPLPSSNSFHIFSFAFLLPLLDSSLSVAAAEHCSQLGFLVLCWLGVILMPLVPFHSFLELLLSACH